MKVSALKAKTRTVQVVIPGEDGGPDESVGVTYRPGALTMELWEKIDILAKDPTSADVEGMKLFLMQEGDPLISGWELEEDDGSPLPCTPENLATLPLQFIGMMADAIGKDSRPDPQKADSSGDGSQPTEESASAQSGTSLSVLPNASDASPGSS